MTGAVSRKVIGKRAKPKFKRKYRITRRGWINLGVLGALLLLIVMLIIVLRSPLIKRISPTPGSTVTTNPVSVEIEFGRKFEASSLTITVDGEDRSSKMTVEDQLVRIDLHLPDGRHTMEIFYQGKSCGKSEFVVDTTPPLLMVEEMDACEDGTTRVKGKVEGAVLLTLEGQKLPPGRDGSFTFQVNRYDHPVVRLAAVDEVGNRSELTLSTVPVPEIKGIHVSIFVAADKKLFGGIVDMVKRTELNGLEIDIKDETGYIGYDSQVELANQLGTDLPKGGMDLGRVMDKCWYNDIYAIARIVCFKDPVLAKKRPDLAVHDKRGGLWGKGQWLDPYNREVWKYILDIATEAASNGFKEIQFDYVRFPSDGDVTACVFPANDGSTQEDTIAEFCKYMRDNLKPLGVVVSADLFGLTASAQGSMGIGQDVSRMAQYLDYLCPMVYPSHYNYNEYNIRVPEANPHDTVYYSLEDFQKKVEGTNCKLRPWLQDFSLKITYGPNEVRAQMNACYELGIEEWLLWDPNCTYTEAALEPGQ
jgi:hypothetical protein